MLLFTREVAPDENGAAETKVPAAPFVLLHRRTSPFEALQHQRGVGAAEAERVRDHHVQQASAFG